VISLAFLLHSQIRQDLGQISRIEEDRETEHSRNNSNGLERLRQQQWLALAENLCSLANLHRESHNYVVAHALSRSRSRSSREGRISRVWGALPDRTNPDKPAGGVWDTAGWRHER